MVQPWSDADRTRMKTELGVQKFEAIGHFLSEGDYLGLNQADFWRAIAEYEKAWNLLETKWQKQKAGVAILEGIANFALRSEDNDLASDVLNRTLPRAEQITTPSLQKALDKLAYLARKQHRN